MKVIPIHLKTANEFVAKFHRHSIPTVSGKFAVGAQDNEQLLGVAIAGRPVARLLDNGRTLEILRVATNGARNANSFLYKAVFRIAKEMGYEKVITYTLQKESGSSLKAIGATVEARIQPQEWNRPNRKRKSQKVYAESKIRWNL